MRPRLHHFAPAILALLVSLLGAQASFAQTSRPERPNRGLFGNTGPADAAQSLIVGGAAGGGWDTSVAADLRTGANDATGVTPLHGAGYGLFAGTVAYNATGRKVSVGASANSTGRYYRSFTDSSIASHAARVALGFQPARSTQISLAQDISYQPFGSLNLFPGLTSNNTLGPDLSTVVTAPSLDLRVFRRAYVSTTSDASFTQQLSRRSSVSASYTLRRSEFSGQDSNFMSQTFSGRYNRSLSRTLGMHVGYGTTIGEFAGSTTSYRNHMIDAGLSFNKALSVSRRTFLSFDSGSTAWSDGQTTRWQVLGGAQLSHEMGRTWTAALNYRRNVQFIETFNQPLFSDSVNGSLGGLFSSRLRADFGGGASNGSFGLVGSSNNVWSYYAQSGLGVALSRFMEVEARYNYFHYKFDGTLYSALGFGADLNRQSIGVFVNASAPVFKKGRRPNASR